MLVTERLVYIHIPKTAGHFAKYYIKKYGGKILYQGEWHGPLSRLPEEYGHLPVVSFVRNPWDWYVSWFFHQKDNGFFNPLCGAAAEMGKTEFDSGMRFIMKSLRRGTKEHKILKEYMRSEKYSLLMKEKALLEPGIEDLNASMVDTLIGKKIGMLTWRLNFLLGEKSKKCIFGRYENLKEDLIKIFETVGVALDENMKSEIMQGKEMNKGKSRFNRGYKNFYDPALVRQVENREVNIIQNFGYSF